MADYFSEYTSFIGNKGLPSPADTPYETPAFIRSKRNSRATTIGTRSREQSNSPPPLPPDPTEDRTRDGRYTALDPRRFTPTLHASLVAEILSLRRELDSKNHLVENLETGLATAKNDSEKLEEQLSASAKEVRIARSQVKQMESGTYEALEAIAKERDIAQVVSNDLRLKLDVAHKKAKLQDDDAVRTQAIWEREKGSWEDERRQLERRIHVTETRLRKFVDEMVSQQTAQTSQSPTEEIEGQSKFKDSGLGEESDAESNGPARRPAFTRQMSNTSFKSSKSRYSVRDNATTPEPAAGFSLADELGGDDVDDDYDIDDSENADDELDYHDAVRQTMDSRQSNLNGDMDSKAKRVLGLTDEVPSSPVKSHSRFGSLDNIRPSLHKRSHSEKSMLESSRKADFEPRPLSIVPEAPVEARKVYVDNGYQPSPPPSPLFEPAEQDITEHIAPTVMLEPVQQEQLSERSVLINPKVAPVAEEARSAGEEKCVYMDMSTQTESTVAAVAVAAVSERDKAKDTLQLAALVPSIAIHPPTSRPATPRPYVLPPGTKNASVQVNLSWSGTDASVQTEEIRIDQRPVKLPAHLLPSYVLKNLPDASQLRTAREETSGSARIIQPKNLASSKKVQSPIETPTDNVGAGLSRDNSSKELRSMPLKAISLPKPTLAPAGVAEKSEARSQGPLNRSAQFGVSHDNRTSRLLANIDNDSDGSDTDSAAIQRVLAFGQRPSGRFTPSEHPRNVPEDKELSPERRPQTTESNDAAPAPSVASSRDGMGRRKRPPPKLNTYTSLRSRSPSNGSIASSSWSAQSALPPYPIPTRSSSRQVPFSYSEGSRSPALDPFGPSIEQTSRSHKARQQSLRKSQSTTSIRHLAKARVSPRKGRRRLRSPELTPVQSMAFESPAPTDFPIPELPTPLQHGPSSDYRWGSRSSRPANTSISSMPYGDESGLVDSIAATMVGEWMWKYIRKRKSFAVGESTEDFAQAAESGFLDMQGIGTRHKRWVWLSPYERTIMWDSKQPTSGTALLGKKGRKLMIQSVIDVKDDSPLPKKPELGSAHSRSILILTPARALKFTTTTAERHQFWMTALSFLAESNRLDAQPPSLPRVPPVPRRAPPPPPPPPPPAVAQRHEDGEPTFGRANIRDSVRLTKGLQSEDIATNGNNVYPRPVLPIPTYEDNGADFPAVPRLYSGTARHQRKRSNTSPRLPPALHTLRSFSPTTLSSSTSARPSGSAGKGNMMSGSAYSASRGTSVTSPDRANFFEATGTVRMDAFVDPNVRDGVLYVPAPPATSAAPPPRRRRGDSNLSNTTVDKRRAGYVFDEDGMDPFKGF